MQNFKRLQRLNGSYLLDQHQNRISIIIQIPLADTMNFVFNSRLPYQGYCDLNSDYQLPLNYQPVWYFEEEQSTTLQIIQKDYTQNFQEKFIIKGDLESESFILSEDNDTSIQLQFISVNELTQKICIGNGLLNLANGNKNNIFIQGYQQNQLISPNFQISGSTFNSNDLFEINYNITTNISYPILKTYSSNNWDVQMAGIFLGDTDMTAIAHFKNFIIQTYTYSALPINQHPFGRVYVYRLLRVVLNQYFFIIFAFWIQTNNLEQYNIQSTPR
ncbi:transmembrane protein, putative (macronuclear) [Tetrahymena thermophila SB210]|uniref:Transmembrane protein, putative n=1 Tax=Tetrahymena thermophila (strain SB210) TaxID=312017 RepID=I7MHV3_TETTS|nr:transmembrane protein, putative [Tetrahymena thermophila SB210]EAR89920.2 transmembrane protein, putative [Tetrahymena thermophila SB210]|eukprot:XP_001010165.2 transmembrane protein, putative [Tetrahymena thermophila SB210]